MHSVQPLAHFQSRFWPAPFHSPLDNAWVSLGARSRPDSNGNMNKDILAWDWRGNRLYFYKCRLRRVWGREFNCINRSCAVPVASEPENRPCSTDMTTILPLLPLDPQEYCANRSMKEESI